ncbi:glycoside hydrolase family 127 protein [Flammeovirgaceae bacterium SG7u.111]|nr:glycoside hydrolase family 127 protein [Flammeovirgaceae bacterium SG7u.132]WPO35154.1 glycoside hydrolase family 127 protein [Flammeovirgaceae bacterium SG7u.111]
MKIIQRIIIFGLSTFLLANCQTKKEEVFIKTEGPEVVNFKVLPFELPDVKLLDGPFKHATELNKQYLLNYEPDRLMARFRDEADLEPKAEQYGGWEGETLAGHTLGHYLSACALMYQTSGEKVFLDRVNHIVAELDTCQQADKDGYMGAFPDGKKVFTEEIAKGEIRSQGFDLNGLWAPIYTMHKVMAGLRDAYHLCGNEKALVIESKFTNWLGTIVKDLNEEQIQNMLNCEHGGVNETLADLYADTGEKKYLDLANVFYHKSILDPLAEEKDILPGKHGNTQIPKLIGLARTYELTGNAKDKNAADFFWETVVKHHSYVTGGHGNHEYFGPADTLRNRLSDGTTETCNVYNMLKLSRHLFEWEASAEVADYYERALFNQILSSQHPRDGRVIYNMSLEMGGYKVYQDPEWFTCCIGTGMENHSKYAANIYYHNHEELYVSQFIASELNWAKKGVKVTQETTYPEGKDITLNFEVEKPVYFTLKIRQPYWLVTEDLKVMVNGEEFTATKTAGSFYAIKKTWKTGDKVEISMPFRLRLETMPDDSDRVAVMYGPLVLAGDLGEIEDPKAHDLDFVPVIMTEDRNPENWLKPVEGKPNTFVSTQVGNPRDVTFKPFYKTSGRRYSVYFDLFTQEKWAKYQADYQAELERKKKLEEMTFDFFQPGEMQPERDHNFQGDSTEVIEFDGRKARHANRSGWFSFDMTTMKGQPMALVIEYWGGFTGSKTFDILVDGQKIVTENISGKKDGSYIDVQYDIPDDLTVSKDKITIRFQPHEGHRAGPIFAARMIKR